MLRIKHLFKTYGLKTAPKLILNDINLHLVTGTISGLMGATGSGKTTLLKIMNGLITPDPDPHTVLQKKFPLTASATIFQNFNLLNNLTVFDNIALSLRLRQYKTTEITVKVSEIADFLGLLPLLKIYPASLSGGQKQKVAIARALVYQPQIIFADEPTSALNYQMMKDILKIFYQINQTFHTTILLISHDPQVITTLCQQVMLLQAGKITQTLKLKPTYDFTAQTDQEILAKYQVAKSVC